MKADIAQWSFVKGTLRALAIWLEENTGLEFTITSPFRINDRGVHGTLPLRAIDLRMRHRAIGEVIINFINSNWVYDPSRPELKCAVLHGKGSALHIHLQVHPDTRRA